MSSDAAGNLFLVSSLAKSLFFSADGEYGNSQDITGIQLKHKAFY